MKNENKKLKKNDILGYFHCKKCVENKLKPTIECGWTPKGLQVRCYTHDINIINMDFMGHKVRIH